METIEYPQPGTIVAYETDRRGGFGPYWLPAIVTVTPENQNVAAATAAEMPILIEDDAERRGHLFVLSPGVPYVELAVPLRVARVGTDGFPPRSWRLLPPDQATRLAAINGPYMPSRMERRERALEIAAEVVAHAGGDLVVMADAAFAFLNA